MKLTFVSGLIQIASLRFIKEVEGIEDYSNIKRHYDSKHADGVYGKLKTRDRELKVKQLKEKLKSQRFMFQKLHTDNKKNSSMQFLNCTENSSNYDAVF